MLLSTLYKKDSKTPLNKLKDFYLSLKDNKRKALFSFDFFLSVFLTFRELLRLGIIIMMNDMPLYVEIYITISCLFLALYFLWF